MSFPVQLFKKGVALNTRIERFIEEDNILAQEKVLKKNLKRAGNTDFGIIYGFKEILKSDDSVRSYQSRIPIFDYGNMYRNWWKRTLNYEADVCWPGRTQHFALSSGTSGSSSKRVPVTAEMFNSIKRASYKQLQNLVHFNLHDNFFGQGILMLGGCTDLKSIGPQFEGDLSGLLAGKLPFWMNKFYRPGKSIAKENDWTKKLDLIVENAHTWDISTIVGVPAWVKMLLEKIIKRYNLNNIHELWPNLSFYVHGGVAFGPYKKGFEELLGKSIDYMETYLASEGFFAFQRGRNTSGMKLLFDNGIFYEFVPFDRVNFNPDGTIKENAVAKWIDEVEEGVEYALLISTNSGAWRYLIGDTIKFVSKEKGEIIITGRTKHFLNLCGEHLSVDNMNMAIEHIEHRMDIRISEFCVTGVKFDEGFAHKWYIGTDDYVDDLLLRKILDETLIKLNDDYAVERNAYLKEILVDILPSEAFMGWMKDKGRMGGQNKFPRVLRDEQQIEWETYTEDLLVTSDDYLSQRR